VKRGHVVTHLVHLNKALFKKASRRLTSAGIWDRWDPAAFTLCEGVLETPVVKTAVCDKTANELNCRVAGLLSFDQVVPWQGFVVVYDDDSQVAVTVPAEFTKSDHLFKIPLAPFANISTYKNIYVYAAYVNGKLDDGKTDPLTVGQRASRTGYLKATIQGSLDSSTPDQPDAGTPVTPAAPFQPADPVEAAALRDEAARLEAEAKRLETEADAADSSPQPPKPAEN
jgi:hypothetical protein